MYRTISLFLFGTTLLCNVGSSIDVIETLIPFYNVYSEELKFCDDGLIAAVLKAFGVDDMSIFDKLGFMLPAANNTTTGNNTTTAKTNVRQLSGILENSVTMIDTEQSKYAMSDQIAARDVRRIDRNIATLVNMFLDAANLKSVPNQAITTHPQKRKLAPMEPEKMVFPKDLQLLVARGLSPMIFLLFQELIAPLDSDVAFVKTNNISFGQAICTAANKVHQYVANVTNSFCTIVGLFKACELN